MKTKFIIVMMLIISVSIISCRKKDDDESEQSSDTGERLTLEVTGNSSSTITETMDRTDSADSSSSSIQPSREMNNPGRDSSPAETTAPVKDIVIDGFELLQLHHSDKQIEVEDFTIGALETDTHGAIVNTAYSFFQGIADRDLKESMIHSDYKASVLRKLPPLGSLPEIIDFRLGKYTEMDSSDTAVMDLLLYSEEGRAEGSIYLELEENVWMIADVAIDFLSLKEQYVRDDEVFEPDVYNYLDVF